MANAPGDPSTTRRARKLVTGVAWTFLILSAWFCLRTVLMALMGKAADLVVESPLETTFGKFWQTILVIHVLVAAFTFFASTALLRFKSWSHAYFMVLFFALALELGYLSSVWLLGPEAENASENGMQGIQIAIGVFFVLMAAMSAILGWKFLKDKAIRTLFHKR